MFLNKKRLFVTFIAVAMTGCATTADTEQQAKITNLESDLNQSTLLTQQTKSELANTQAALQIKQEKIITLTSALEKSQKALKVSQSSSSPTTVMHADDKTILGQTEWVYVSEAKENFKGRIDTGAATSSINAVDIVHFERDGKKWVRFNLTHAEGEKADIIEAKVIRIAKVKQSSQPDKITERAVIALHVRIGDISQLTEFTLTNRLHMAYPVLIGRTFLQDLVLVDVSKEYSFTKYQAPIENKN